AIGRMRRFIPRKTDLAMLPKREFNALLRAYNSTPRKCLDFKTPAETFSELLHFECESTSALSRGRTGGVFCPLQLLVFGAGLACLPVQAATEAEQNMVGAWEISNAARDKLCPVSFAIDRVERGLKIELDGACGTAFPSMKGIAAWGIGPKDTVQLID